MSPFKTFARHWVIALLYPRPLVGLLYLPCFVSHWIRYAGSAGAQKIRVLDLQPCLGDWSTYTPFDANYLSGEPWLARRVCSAKVARHVDIGSSVLTMSVLSAQVETTFIDYRPLKASLPSLTSIARNILDLPFLDGSVSCLSCLHVIEHIGLGRYGDPIDSQGSVKAALELQRIVCLLKQRYAGLEYIIIDGGSTDGTVDIIKSHASGIAKWVSEKDNGIADAFNKGLSFSTGDYLLFLNVDDVMANAEALERVAGEIAKNSSPTLLYEDFNVLDRSSGEVLYRASIEVPHKKLLLGKMSPQPNLFTHRPYFEKYGIFDLDFKIAMDFEWLLRGWLVEHIVHIPLLVTNVRDGGISTLDQKRVADEIIRALKKNGYISSKWAELELRGYYLMRSFAKSILEKMGLYKMFAHLRNRRQG